MERFPMVYGTYAHSIYRLCTDATTSPYLKWVGVGLTYKRNWVQTLLVLIY